MKKNYWAEILIFPVDRPKYTFVETFLQQLQELIKTNIICLSTLYIIENKIWWGGFYKDNLHYTPLYDSIYLFFLSFYKSLRLFVSVSLFFPACLFVSQSSYISVCLFVSLDHCLSWLFMSLSPFVSLIICQYVSVVFFPHCPFVSINIQYFSLSICLYTCLSPCLSCAFFLCL